MNESALDLTGSIAKKGKTRNYPTSWSKFLVPLDPLAGHYAPIRLPIDALSQTVEASLINCFTSSYTPLLPSISPAACLISTNQLAYCIKMIPSLLLVMIVYCTHLPVQNF